MSRIEAFFDTHVLLYMMSSALLAGCDRQYTEDLQDGQIIEHRLVVQNPFADLMG